MLSLSLLLDPLLLSQISNEPVDLTLLASIDALVAGLSILKSGGGAVDKGGSPSLPVSFSVGSASNVILSGHELSIAIEGATFELSGTRGGTDGVVVSDGWSLSDACGKGNLEGGIVGIV